jgi:hypothetical protein
MKGEGLGGVRPGAGRPPQSFTLRLGAQFGVFLKTADGGRLPMQLADVEEITRQILVLKLDNGDKLTIFR